MKVCYVRVSSVDQCYDRQTKAMEEIGVEKSFVEKISGKNLNRPQLKSMLDFVRTGDTLYVESFSRLARSTQDLLSIIERLNEKGVSFVSLKENIDTTTPQGKFILTVFAGLAEFERTQLLQRQREGIECAKAAGKYKGRKPIDRPENFEEVVKLWKEGEITARKAQQKLGLTPSTFYRMVK